MISPLDALLLALVLVSGIAALVLSDLLDAVVAFGCFSFFSAVFFASLGALDVAFTEAAVGAAITTLFFVAVIGRVERRTEARPFPPRRRWAGGREAAALTLAGLVLGSAMLELPAVGDPGSPASRHVSPRYIERGAAETGAANLVTAVLADYRAYDTLGETVVILTAGLACALVLGNLRPAGRRP